MTYNAAVFGGAAAAAGLSIGWIDTQNVGDLVPALAIAAFVDYWVNLLLITLVVSMLTFGGDRTNCDHDIGRKPDNALACREQGGDFIGRNNDAGHRAHG